MKNKILRILFIILITAVSVFLAWRIFAPIMPGLLSVLKSGDEKAIQAYLENSGKVEGYICTVLLQFMQVISVVLPGMPIQIAAGIVFGAWRSTLLCFFGYVGANVVVFLIARRIGKAFSQDIVGKFKNNWFSKQMQSMHPGFIVAMGCFMPGIPNGIIPYIAAGAQISTAGFTFAVAVGSFLPIVCSCMCGHFVLVGNYIFSIVSIAVMWVMIIILLINRDRISAWIGKIARDKQTENKDS